MIPPCLIPPPFALSPPESPWGFFAVGKILRGALPPVLLVAVCFERAMLLLNLERRRGRFIVGFGDNESVSVRRVETVFAPL